MQNYSFKVLWSDEDQGYVAVCPEFPGVSAFGDTPEHALAEVKIPLEMAIETYEEEGWPLPEPKTHTEHSGQFRVRLPKHLHTKLAARAEDEGVSLNTLIATYLAEAIGVDSTLEKLREVLQGRSGSRNEPVTRAG
jgi:predicted RNase H-like HicB family nuclease